MIRNYKAFGLALVAMFALSAFVAQGASASPLTTGSANTWYTGDQDGGIHVFKSSAEVKCTTASFTAKSTTTSVNELTVTPAYSSCTAFGFATAHVKMNGCTYTFTTPTQIKAGEVKWSGAAEAKNAGVHIVCPESKKIEVTPTSLGVSVCTQSIAAQSPASGHVIGKNAGTAEEMDITLEVTLSGISYTGTGSACGTSGTTATYNGSSTIKCYSNETHATRTSCTFS